MYLNECFFDPDDDMWHDCNVVSKVKPCDCLDHKTLPKDDAERDKSVCIIEVENEHDCSDPVKVERLRGWQLKIEYSEIYGTGCEPEDKVVMWVKGNQLDKTCICGEQVINVSDVSSYRCEYGVAWRCVNPEGCICGQSRVKYMELCLNDRGN
jgi:hypothetical protein